MAKSRKTRRKFKKSIKLFLAVILIVIVGSIFIKPSSISKVSDEALNVLEKPTDEDNTVNVDISKYHIEEITDPIEKKIKENLVSLNDMRAFNILDNYSAYPVDLLESLTRNEDMLDFVSNYPTKKGELYATSIGNVKKGVIPLLLQWDDRWGYYVYGDNIMALNGCGPTALSMVLSGLTGDNTITPAVIAKFSFDNGYYDMGIGTSWSLMTNAPLQYGVKSKELPLSKSVVMNTLKSGKPIICIMGPGDFTLGGHYIVLTGVKDGKLIIRDSNSVERSNKLWDFDEISSQIRNLWSFSLK